MSLRRRLHPCLSLTLQINSGGRCVDCGLSSIDHLRQWFRALFKKLKLEQIESEAAESVRGVGARQLSLIAYKVWPCKWSRQGRI